MWLTRDNHGYRLWLVQPDFGNDMALDLSMPLNHRNIEDIFVKLDGGELEIGESIRVNLVEDDLNKGKYDDKY